jgi:hypothetical protein
MRETVNPMSISKQAMKFTVALLFSITAAAVANVRTISFIPYPMLMYT